MAAQRAAGHRQVGCCDEAAALVLAMADSGSRTCKVDETANETAHEAVDEVTDEAMDVAIDEADNEADKAADEATVVAMVEAIPGSPQCLDA